MRPWLKKPKTETIAHKPDNNDPYYEIYVLIPVKVGEVRIHGSQQVTAVAASGEAATQRYASLEQAADDLARRSGYLSGIDRKDRVSPRKKLWVLKRDLVKAAVWDKYCELYPDVAAASPDDRQCVITVYQCKQLNYPLPKEAGE